MLYGALKTATKRAEAEIKLKVPDTIGKWKSNDFKCQKTTALYSKHASTVKQISLRFIL